MAPGTRSPYWREVVHALVALATLAVPATGQGPIVLHANGSPLWGDTPRLVEEVRIGSLESEAASELGEVGGVAVTESGEIWVGDRQLGAVLRYTRDGVYIDDVGRSGEGPGEFKYLANMRRLPDGSMAVWDDGLLRVSQFDATGAFVGSFSPLVPMMAGPDLEEFEVDVEGNLYLVSSIHPRVSGDGWKVFWVKVRPDGEVLDTIRMVPGEREGIVDPIVTRTVLSPLGYVITARNNEYALILHPDSEPARRIERPWEAVPYQRGERSEKQGREEMFSGRNGRPERRIPRTKPAFSSFEVDAQGRIWVTVNAPGYREAETPGEQEVREEACRFWGATPAECDEGVREWRQPFVCEVIGPDGTYFGRLEFPNRQTDVVFAEDNRVWVVEKGEFDEPYVVRYRIEPGR